MDKRTSTFRLNVTNVSCQKIFLFVTDEEVIYRRNLPWYFSNIDNQGYVLDEHNVRCVNIDECAIMHGVCGNGTCIDVPGSFTCKCDPGKLDRLREKNATQQF
jgi:hypothetical protein